MGLYSGGRIIGAEGLLSEDLIIGMLRYNTYIGRDIIGGLVLMRPRFFSSPSRSPPARVHKWYTSCSGLKSKKKVTLLLTGSHSLM